MVRVRDAGIGIHPEMLPRVFDMFRPGRSYRRPLARRSRHRPLARSSGSSKCTAARSRRTARASAAAASSWSALPAIERGAAPARAGGRQPVGTRRRRKILVVDDNADAAESLAALLAIGGHETRLAHDGSGALEQAGAFQPDVVFLDIGMPTLDGHETARRIRAAAVGQGHGAGGADRMGTDRRSAAIEGSRLQPSPGEARRSRGGRRNCCRRSSSRFQLRVALAQHSRAPRSAGSALTGRRRRPGVVCRPAARAASRVRRTRSPRRSVRPGAAHCDRRRLARLRLGRPRLA